MKDIGDRMKANYERRSRHELVRRMPVIVRVDGRAFHTYTRGMAKPFDQRLMENMARAAWVTGQEMQGFKAAYVQSDEASFLLTDYDSLQTEGWFGYCQNKVESLSASIMTAAFNRLMNRPQLAHFDARAFNVPRSEVANYFLWRMKDWERNSLQMYASTFFSHKELHRKGRAAKHEMLHGIGKNWATDLSPRERNGTWVFPCSYANWHVTPTFGNVADLLHDSIYCDEVTQCNAESA